MPIDHFRELDVYRAEVNGQGALRIGNYDFPNHPVLLAQLRCMKINNQFINFDKPDVDYEVCRNDFQDFFGEDLLALQVQQYKMHDMINDLHHNKFYRYGWNDIEVFRWFVKDIIDLNKEIEFVKYKLKPKSYFVLPDGQVIFKGRPERFVLERHEVVLQKSKAPFHCGDVWEPYTPVDR